MSNFCYELKIIQRLTYNHGVLGEFIGRHLEVQRCRPFSNSTAGIVVRTVAGTIVTTKFASIGDWNATQVRTHSDNHKPFWTLNSCVIGLRIAKSRYIYTGFLFNFRLRPEIIIFLIVRISVFEEQTMSKIGLSRKSDITFPIVGSYSL